MLAGSPQGQGLWGPCKWGLTPAMPVTCAPALCSSDPEARLGLTHAGRTAGHRPTWRNPQRKTSTLLFISVK